ncbi:hypothetical protein BD413DRAFT_471036 [Trametes elegans]|nr:hypothetical protein BD413DRAFT_471036 [Trametes elegans]
MAVIKLRKKGEEYSREDVPDMTGKTALLTGATTGVGLEVARVLAAKGARVILLARKEDHPDDAIERMRRYSTEKAGVKEPDLSLVECDLANLEEVKRIGDELCERESRLDVVVCDAGEGVQTFDVSADGIDRHFAVSHLGHFLLLNRLLPLLHRTASAPAPAPSPSPSPTSSTTSPSSSSPRASSPSPSPAPAPATPRIVCVTSALHAHAAAPPNVHFLSHAELTAESCAASSPLGLYARSKLAAILFVKFGLAPRLSTTSTSTSTSSDPAREPKPNPADPPQRAILALAADAGPVPPGQPAQYARAYGPVLGTAAQLAAASLERAPADAARSTLWAATAPEVAADSARWQGACVVAPGVERAEKGRAGDEELGARLWAMSEDLVRKRLGKDALRPWTWDAEER